MSNSILIRDFITKNLVRGREELTLGDEDHLFDKGFVNSLFAMKLLTFVEKNFNINIEPDEMNLENFSTINKICSLISKKINVN